MVICCLLSKAVDTPKSIGGRLNVREFSNGIINVWDDGNGSVSSCFALTAKGMDLIWYPTATTHTRTRLWVYF